MLFYNFPSADLASHSGALTPYELLTINQLGLASFAGLDYLTAQVLDAFHIPPR